MQQKQSKIDHMVFIGRFQPYHLGHQTIVKHALEVCDSLIILVGSTSRPRSTRNPWTFEERELMIRSTLSEAENLKVKIHPLVDEMYNDTLWCANVQKIVSDLTTVGENIALIGHSKDSSSYYLKRFPQWSFIDVALELPLSATNIRKALFTTGTQDLNDQTHLPTEVLNFIEQSAQSKELLSVRDEFSFVETYKKAWEDAPYPPTFVTVDAVVIQSAHILLVERGARPGKGLLALPGGFVNQTETLKDACLRELREETRIKVPKPVLAGHIVDQQLFDNPHRSARGRTISHGFLIHLSADTALPKVKGGDDAHKAFWVPLADLDSRQMFEDHYFIIQKMVALLD